MNLIEVDHVSKIFRLRAGGKLLREQIRELLHPDREAGFYALRDVSFRVTDGESVAIIGANGAGKSTLLSLIAGLTAPDSGTVTVSGRIAALMELGSGFHPDLTGIENTMLNASLLGFDEKHIRDRLPAIVEFAEIGDFINEPIRTYSSGMVVRLAFSIAIHADPAILIVDEVLGVGDSHFQEKCFASIEKFRREGRTMLAVSHNPKLVFGFCDRAIWLDHGRMVLDGDAATVMEEYSLWSANPAAGLPDIHSAPLGSTRGSREEGTVMVGRRSERLPRHPTEQPAQRSAVRSRPMMDADAEAALPLEFREYTERASPTHIHAEQAFPEARLLQRALDMIGSPERLAQWIQTPLPALNGRTPYALMHSEEGRKEIENALDRLEYGVY
jgi:ABC-type polysaccharide/polyol phosphate transport system ATPase subunit